MSVEYEKHLKLISALLVVFAALTGSVVILSIADENQMQTGQFSPHITSVAHKNSYGDDKSRLLKSLLSSAAPDSTRPEMAVLDNDQDYDGNYDGMADPLAVLGLVLIGVVMGFVLRPLVGGRLLLVVYQLPELFSIWLQALERPG